MRAVLRATEDRHPVEVVTLVVDLNLVGLSSNSGPLSTLVLKVPVLTVVDSLSVSVGGRSIRVVTNLNLNAGHGL